MQLFKRLNFLQERSSKISLPIIKNGRSKNLDDAEDPRDPERIKITVSLTIRTSSRRVAQ